MGLSLVTELSQFTGGSIGIFGMVLHTVVANPLSPKNGSDISYRNDSLYIGLQKKGVQHIK